jgi:hypothetical protein
VITIERVCHNQYVASAGGITLVIESAPFLASSPMNTGTYSLNMLVHPFRHIESILLRVFCTGGRPNELGYHSGMVMIVDVRPLHEILTHKLLTGLTSYLMYTY